ncbi:L-2-amino-thiazoline-4-carboxylic acid hydrolase [Bradyrhizobium huanghuaihaiense]|nr:L-2-amino-thiazoline-4-carboxylic acid hydrolase [Bradyrhizobium huanghuaihaiense]
MTEGLVEPFGCCGTHEASSRQQHEVELSSGASATADGFGPDVRLTHTQTIMQGASYCDFRYRRDEGGSQ